MAKFCPNCGNPIDEGAVFCNNCGYKLAAQPNPRPEQTHTQPNSRPTQQYPQQPPQPTQQYAPYRQPMQQPYPPNQPYPQNYVQPKKKKTGLIVALIIAGVAVAVFIAILVGLIIPMLNPHKDNPLPTQAEETVAESMTEAPTEAPTKVPTEKPTEAPTKAPTEAPTEPPTEAPKKLPYVDSLGKINDYDFAWISDAMSGGLTGDFLSNDELLGKWKGEFIFDGIWELVYVTIESDGTVTVEPYQINYGDGWENESGDAPYSFSGSFDINRVYGSGKYGKIDLYQFLESADTQYGVGKLEANTGYTAKVYLVRP